MAVVTRCDRCSHNNLPSSKDSTNGGHDLYQLQIATYPIGSTTRGELAASLHICDTCYNSVTNTTSLKNWLAIAQTPQHG